MSVVFEIIASDVFSLNCVRLDRYLIRLFPVLLVVYMHIGQWYIQFVSKLGLTFTSKHK